MKKPYIIQREQKSDDDFLSCKIKRVNNKKLKINRINVTKSYVEISIEHSDFKWIEYRGTMLFEEMYYEFGYSNFDDFTKEFRNKWENNIFIFALVVPQEFIDKYNLDAHVYHRVDGYDTQLLFKRLR